MKRFLASFLTLVLTATAIFAQSPVYVRPYLRSNGTYVQGHYRTAPDNTINNNWSTYPNVNPYTGRVGTRQPDYGATTLGGGGYTSTFGSSYTSPSGSFGNWNSIGTHGNSFGNFNTYTMPSTTFTYPTTTYSYGFGSSFGE